MAEPKKPPSKAAAYLLIFGPIVACAVRIPMMLQHDVESGYAMGSLVGYLAGSLVSIGIGVSMLLRQPKD